MPDKQATVVWTGDLRQGHGEVSTPDGILQRTPITYVQRFENAPGASPEELIAAAHAGCFSMALASDLSRQGHPPAQLATRATVTVEPERGGWTITRSHIQVQGQVPGIDDAQFQRSARQAEESCPVSRALHANVEITLEAALQPVAERA